MTIPFRISKTPNADTRLGRVLPVQEDHKAPATLKRLVPHHGSIQMPMRSNPAMTSVAWVCTEADRPWLALVC
jgi:hypothetical protein